MNALVTTPDSNLLSALQAQGLGKILALHAEDLLRQIEEMKEVTTMDLVSLISSNAKSEGMIFSVALRILTEVFEKKGIDIVYTPPVKPKVVPFHPPVQLPKHPEIGSSGVLTVSIKPFGDQFLTPPPVDLKLPTGNIDNAVNAPEWYDHTLEENEGKDMLAVYLKEMGKYKLLKNDEQIQLCALAQQGDVKARNKVVCGNLRLVVWNAMKFRGRITSDNALEFLDLIQEGNRGLLRAIETYDSEKGAFTTYATLWIRQSIQRSLADNSRKVRIPVHMVERIHKYQKIHSMLAHVYGDSVPMEEIAHVMQINLEEACAVAELISQNFTNVEGYRQDGDGAFQPYIPDRNKIADEKVSDKQMTLILMKVLKMELSPKEYEIYTFRFGLEGNHPHTLEQIGQKFNVTRERIRQIEKKALDKIKYNPQLISLARSMNYRVDMETLEIAKDLVKAERMRRSLEALERFSVKNATLADYIADPFALTEAERVIQKKDIVKLAGGEILLVKQLMEIRADEKDIALFSLYYELGVNSPSVTMESVVDEFKVALPQAINTIFQIWKKLVAVGCSVTSNTVIREMEYFATLKFAQAS